MVKLAKGAKAQNKPKKAVPPPPKDVDDSEEEEDMEEDSGEEEVEVPVKKTPAKKAATPAKATPGKKGATPAKVTATPGKKGATPAGAKNGKQAKKQKQESENEEDEEESDEESEDEKKPVAKKPATKKPVTKKDESEEDEDDEEDDEDESEEELSANKPAAKPVTKPAAKKPAKEEDSEDEEEDSEDEEMEVTPVVTKGKKATPVKAKESDEEEEDDEDDDDDDEDDDDEEETLKESGKRKKEIPKKSVPEKKQKTTENPEGLSVFVANLNFSKDFDELKDALRDFFTKKNLAVRDCRIGSSKKFGYVEFASEEDVETALTFNGKKVLGFDMKLDKAMAFDKTKSAEVKKERDSRTLFVKNLPYSTTSEDLQEIFENAKEVRLPTGKEGSSKGIAYIEFNSEGDANNALEEKQGTEIEGRAIFLDFTGSKSQNTGGRKPGSQGDSKTLVVNNLAYSATEDSIQEVFEKATSIRIPQGNQGRPKGFAFVEFSSVEDAKEAMDTLNNTEIEGRSVRLEFSTGGGPQGAGRGGSAQTKTLFVKGLSEDTTEETLKEAFDGSVNARIVTDRDTGASKGFGFVDFSSAEDAKAAKEAMEDGEIDGSRVTLDFAKPKGDSRGGGRGGFGGRGGGGRGGFGGRGGGGRGGFGGRGGGGRGRGGFGGRGGGGFRGGNQGGQGKKIKFDD